MTLPIVDLHCDLLSYLAKVPAANPYSKDDIACAIPFLKAGGVRMQVLAIYTDVNPQSMKLASKQADIFQNLLEKNPLDLSFAGPEFLSNWKSQNNVGIIASVENAAGIGNETASLEEIKTQFDSILEK
ncbi:membrane dipeptidase, partial [Algoriphagus sp.]|uniref:membrane dipeptidase n=1 Tax=Algoriphagus sp. TaxID=1872435 RepID=UPI0025FD797E